MAVLRRFRKRWSIIAQNAVTVRSVHGTEYAAIEIPRRRDSSVDYQLTVSYEDAYKLFLASLSARRLAEFLTAEEYGRWHALCRKVMKPLKGK